MGLSSSYIKTEQSEEKTIAMVIGDDFPVIVDELVSYLKSATDVVYVGFDRDALVDYLIVFDQPGNIEKYLKNVKDQGRVLHVLSKKAFAYSKQEIPTFYLSPKKEYKSQALVKILIQELLRGTPYTPIKPVTRRKKTSMPRDQHIPLPIKRVIVSAVAVCVLLLLPFLITGSSAAYAAYSLYHSLNPSVEPAQKIELAERAETATMIAQTSYKAIGPAVQIISPSIDTIITNHLVILSSVSHTSTQAYEQFPVFESFITTLTNKNPNKIATEATRLSQALQIIENGHVACVPRTKQHPSHDLRVLSGLGYQWLQKYQLEFG